MSDKGDPKAPPPSPANRPNDSTKNPTENESAVEVDNPPPGGPSSRGGDNCPDRGPSSGPPEPADKSTKDDDGIADSTDHNPPNDSAEMAMTSFDQVVPKAGPKTMKEIRLKGFE
ncbi:hypothetical protein DL767_006645 [Monosporascus sp. MG133]|nr:hypothetical protein DL767_006645 [Monosporascus sp. MG133]